MAKISFFFADISSLTTTIIRTQSGGMAKRAILISPIVRQPNGTDNVCCRYNEMLALIASNSMLVNMTSHQGLVNVIIHAESFFLYSISLNYKQDSRLNAPVELHPIALTTAYLQFASRFGTFIEVRSAQNTQHLPIFVRMMDKDSKWTKKNGLATLIPALLHSNIVGYPYVLPDMIGGNGYDEKPDKELFIRWLQAIVFMPSMQFSYVPWDFDQETIEISREYTKLHSRLIDHFVHQMKVTVRTGEPLNLPIWWFDPEDTVAQQVDDGKCA